MVLDAIYNDGFTRRLVDQIANYSVKLAAPLFINYRFAEFYRKYGLDVDLMVCVSHFIVFKKYRKQYGSSLRLSK
jgi:hypothetical protein